MPSRTRIEISPADNVSALVYAAPPRKRAGIGLLLAHGAGGNQMSPFMVEFASRTRGAGDRRTSASSFTVCHWRAEAAASGPER